MKSTLRAFVAITLLLCAGSPATGQQGARVESFTPQGTVKGVSQALARFSEAMVPFGDPSAAGAPFEVSCAAKGTGRWVDPRNWAFDFDETLPAGVRCEFRLREGLRTLAGGEITGQKAFAFSTGGPAITASVPYEGSTIEEEQVFILELDGAASEESVLKNAYFTVEGTAGRVGARPVAAKDREAILRSEFRYDKEKLASALKNSSRFPLLQARQRFPAGAKLSLVWGKGVASPGGAATEEDQILPFVTRTPFTATFHCSRVNPDAQCVPITPVRLSFSAPVTWSQARRIVLRGPGGKRFQATAGEGEQGDESFVSDVSFKGPFPERASLAIEIPGGLQDDSGRRLSNADKFPMQVQTDEYPPLAKFAADFGILELNANPMLPVTVRNIEPEVSARMFEVAGGEGGMDPPKPAGQEPGVQGSMRGRMVRIPADKASQMLRWIGKVAERSWEDRDKSVFGEVTAEKAQRFTIPKLQGPKSFEVVGIPIKKPGFYVVEIESELLGSALLGERKPMYVPTTVLVTNLAVHFKHGADASLVWVTTLDNARPVAGAAVQVRNCEGTVVSEGKTDTSGMARMRLPATAGGRECSYERYGQGLLVTAQLGDDMAFVHTSWDDGIEPWRFQLPAEWRPQLAIAHTVLDRPLFRAGEVVHMKHFLRRRGTAGMASPAPGDLGKSVVIQHVGTDQRYELPVKWDTQGIAESEWKIPKEARLGEYQVLLARQPKNETHPPSAQFRVEEFRVPLMRGIVKPPSEALVAPSSVPVDLSVHYLAGGGASSLPVRFRYEIVPGETGPFEGFDSFTFSRGRVREGLTRGEREDQGQAASEIQRQDLTLDRSGSVRTVIANLPKIEKPMEIRSELEFQDPNGEIQTVSSRIPLHAAGRVIGLRRSSWMVSREGLKLQAAVTGLDGRAVADAPVRVDLFLSKTYSHRKRLVGGFYAYEHSTEVKRIQTLCEGKTDARGLLLCEKPLPVTGNIYIQATTRDAQGREAATYEEAWVAGGETWFRVEDGDRIDLLPEARHYEPGDKARFQVRMPFRTATALITVEREGVADAIVQEISGKDPVIEIPVKGNYAPNVFISVLAVRGRAGDVQPTATVDLGRPAYKLGIAEINVGWRAHELKVKVTPERPVYRVREKAKVVVAVTTADGKAPPRGAEIALSAVDEGLLELMPNRTWQLLEAMMSRRAYGVHTSTAQMYIVGRRHFGLKALPQGGGGGRQTTRELFDTLLVWRGRVRLDAQGRAEVEIPLNDSITGFRIAAIAHAGVGLFGTASSSIRSNQDLILFSGLPPVVRHGDRFQAEFTLRNTTEKPMEIQVAARVTPLSQTLAPVTLQLPPGESRQAAWEIGVPAGVESLQYEIDASGAEGIADRLKVTQKVAPVVPVRTFQATISQPDAEFRMDVERPRDALAGLGGIQVTLRPSLLDSLAGVTDYMLRYPYTCLEQEVSRAIALKDVQRWNTVMAQLPSYLDGDGLAKYFPSSHTGSDTLTSYLLSVAHEAGREIPERLLARMLNGLRALVEGRITRHGSMPTADLAIRKMAAVEALSRWKDKGPQPAGQPNASPLKIDDTLLSSFTIEPNLWPTSAVLDWFNVLRRVPGLANRDARLGEAEQILRSRLSFQGTTMGFSTERQDALWWLMVSPDVNAVRLLLAVIDTPAWKEDIPRLVRGALQRQRRGAWDITVANAWGTLAVDRFARAFESVPVSGTSSASLAGNTQSVDWTASAAGKTLSFDWPPGQSPLRVVAPAMGKPWLTVQSLAAIPLRQPLSAGFRIRKTLTAVEQKTPGGWSRGDIVRVRLEMESQGDMTWVVVSDPIPAGAAILGTGLGRDSRLAVKTEEQSGWAWPAFEERSFEAFRSYFDYVPKGSWTVEYTMRLNGQGAMNLPATRVEAMYAPEMYAEIPNEPLRIR